MSDLSRAIEFAARMHRNQKDKSGAPYILHPLRVMLAAREKGLDEECQIAGAMHDILEDCDPSMDDIMIFNSFPQKSRELVHILTRKEHETYNEFIDRISQSGPEAIELKLCDIIDNMTRDTDKEFVQSLIENRYKPASTKLFKALLRHKF